MFSLAAPPAKKSATVEVQVQGLKLVEPGSIGGESTVGQGHLHHRLDQGPVIATSATTLGVNVLCRRPRVRTVGNPFGSPSDKLCA
jgi:hypothetical protein